MIQETQTIFDFEDPSLSPRWTITNDVVMGGKSQSQMILTPNGTSLFQGSLSLENQGGFASARLENLTANLSPYTGISIRGRGDGKHYQFRLHTTAEGQEITYRHTLDTEPGTWATFRFPFADFEPISRGTVLKQAPPLMPENVAGVGFLISGGQSGDFRLEISWIKAYLD